MGYVFWGMVFVLLEIPLKLGGRTVGLLPDWLGYWWLAKGFGSMEAQWGGFRKGQTPALVLAVFTGIRYVMDLLVLSARQKFWAWLLGLAAAVAAVLMARLVSKGIRHLEEKDRDLQGRKLENLWLYLVVVQLLGALLSWLPLVGTVCAVASIVMALCWLAVLWRAKTRER